MVLANVAWILASNGKKVLTVDWDLEAPGLHRYFYPFLVDRDLMASDGLIDCFTDFAVEAVTPAGTGTPSSDSDWQRSRADLLRYAVSLEWEFPDDGRLDFIPAGRQGSLYSTRVNSFDWRNFYERLGGGAFLDDVKDWMRGEYDYVLIDSRTGVSDTSSICTVKMPDTLVVFFTMNNQSIDGASAVADSVFSQREDIRIFPVLTRVDTFETDKAAVRQKYAEQMFFRFPKGFSQHERSEYWGNARIPYWPVFSYEEVLAIFRDSPQDPTRVLAGCVRLTSYLTDRAIERLGDQPSEEMRQQVLADFAGPQGSGRPAIVSDSDTAEGVLRTASETWRVLTPSERDGASRVFLRLVQSLDDHQTVLRNASIEEFKDATIIDLLAARSLIGRTKNPTTGRETLRLAHESLLHWPELMSLVTANADFLRWRQRLDAFVNDWEASGRDTSLLLTPSLLNLYVQWRDRRRDDLSEAELAYIAASETVASEQAQPTRTLAVFALFKFFIRFAKSETFAYALGLLVAMGGIIALILFLLGR
jgi:hypothetical protein